MRKATISLAIVLAVSGSASADGDRSGVEAVRVEAAKTHLSPLPGPVYDEAGRLVAAPPPSNVRSRRDVALRLPVLREPRGDAGSGPPRTGPPTRGEP